MVADAEVTPGAGAPDAPVPVTLSADGMSPVQITDVPESRVHRMTDVAAMGATVVAIAVVLLLGAYAQATTSGLTQDIQGVSSLLQKIFVAPVNIFSGIVTLVIPATVIISLAVRREPQRILEVLGAAIGGFILTGIGTAIVTSVGSSELLNSLSVSDGAGGTSVQLPAYISAVAAMLTAAGRRSTRRSLSISWNVLWTAAAVAVISGIVTVPAALVTIFIGRLAGLGLRYALGSSADRAYGESLVEAIQRAGYDPKRIVRADATYDYIPETLDEVSRALGRTRQGRVYTVTTRENHHLIAVALDGDKHAVGVLSKWWSSVRLRGINARADVSLRHSAEATALVSLAARTAGVHTARVLGMSHVRDTFLVVYQRPAAAKPLSEFADEEVTDQLLDAVWSEDRKGARRLHHPSRAKPGDRPRRHGRPVGARRLAHELGVRRGRVVGAGAAHRPRPGARHDRRQGGRGPRRRVGVPFACPGGNRTLRADASVDRDSPHHSPRHPREWQPQGAGRGARRDPRSPARRRRGARGHHPVRLAHHHHACRRHRGRGLVVFGLNTQKILAALQEANPWWLLVAVSFDLLTFAGAAVVMLAFSPIKLPWSRVVLVQAAAAYLALAAPAGVGPAALNLRMLTRRKVPRRWPSPPSLSSR